MAETMYGNTAAPGADIADENNTEYYGASNARQRFPGLYVGNLTWWTTDQDVINSINSVGVRDVQEVKFFENRNNGQSKGFCVVTFGSEASLPIVMEKLPKLELYGQNPVVTPYNRQNLNLFESQTKARLPINQGTNGPNHAAGIMGISSISGVHAGTQGLPYSGMNTYGAGAIGANAGAGGGNLGPRNPLISSYNPNMRFLMRTPRPNMRGPIPGAMNNGPGGPGMMQQMTRVRFMHPMGWNNSQSTYNSQGTTYNSSVQAPHRDEMSSRLDDRIPSSSSRREKSHRSDERDRSDERVRTDDRNRSDERDRSNERDRSDQRVRSDDRDRSDRPDQRIRSDERSRTDQRVRSDDRDRSDQRIRSDDRDRSDQRVRSDDRSRSDGRVRSDHRYRSDQRGRSRSRERSRERSHERKERRDRRDRY